MPQICNRINGHSGRILNLDDVVVTINRCDLSKRLNKRVDMIQTTIKLCVDNAKYVVENWLRFFSLLTTNNLEGFAIIVIQQMFLSLCQLADGMRLMANCCFSSIPEIYNWWTVIGLLRY